MIEKAAFPGCFLFCFTCETGCGF